MPRPRCHRRIGCHHGAFVFKPRGIPMSELETEFLGIDELEAMRLADIEGMYQEDAAKLMGISRSTFARMVDAGHQKITRALINKSAIELVGSLTNKENKNED